MRHPVGDLANRMLEREAWARERLARARRARGCPSPSARCVAAFAIDASRPVEPEPSAGAARPHAVDLAADGAGVPRPTRRAGTNSSPPTATPSSAATFKDLAQTLPWFVEQAFAEPARPRRRPARRRRRTPAARLSRIRARARRRQRRELRPRRGRAARARRRGAASRGGGGRRRRRRARRARRRAGRRLPGTHSTRRLRAGISAHSGRGRYGASGSRADHDAEIRPHRHRRAGARQVQPAAAVQRPEARAAVPAARRASRASDRLDRRAARRRQVDAGGELRRGAQGCPASGSRPTPATPTPARSSTTCASRRRTSPARGPKALAALPRFSPEYARDLPAFTRRFLREFFALFPPGVDARRRQFPRAAGRSPRGASRSPRGCARFPEGMNLIFLSREPPPPEMARLVGEQRSRGSTGRRCASPPTRREAMTASARLDAGAGARHPPRERRLGRRHRADARASRARGGAPRPRRRAARRQGGGVPYFTGEIFGRARAENQRMLLLAALLPSVVGRATPRRSPATRRRRCVLDYVYRQPPLHRPPPHRRRARLPVPRAVPRVPARRGPAPADAATSAADALDRAGGQLVARGDFDARGGALHRGAGVAGAGGPHAARGRRRCSRKDARKTLAQVAGRAAGRRPRRPSRGCRWAEAYAVMLQRPAAREGAARARVRRASPRAATCGAS